MRFESMSKAVRRFVILAAGLAVTACATPGPVFRTTAVPNTSTRVITVDAKLRNVFMVPPGSDGAWRVCAEASPDVFSALAASTSASLGAQQSQSSTEANARFAHAVAEAAGTVERTQTVNLLRESMYRTCERYLSGAISREAFVVQSGRDWRAMIAILAIEQLTRTVRPAATIIIPPSTSAVITEPTELAAELRRAAAATESARIARDAADAAYDAAGCPVPPPAPADTPDVVARRQNCQALDGNRTAAAQELRRAEAAQTALGNALAANPGQAPTTNAGTGSGTGVAGGQDGARSASDLQAVAGSVQAIVRMAFDTNEIELFCVQMLSGDFRGSAGDRSELERACIRYALNRVNAAAGVTPQFLAAVQNDMGQLRAYLGADPGVARTRWEQLLADAGLTEAAPDLVQAVSVDQMIAALQAAFPSFRDLVIGAMNRRRQP